MTIAMSYLFKMDINIKKIRGKRGNKAGGLGHQHLTGVITLSKTDLISI